MQHLRQQLENKKMIYSKDQIQLSTTVGQGIMAILHIINVECNNPLGESGLVYKGYVTTSIGKELVAVKTGKGINY